MFKLRRLEDRIVLDGAFLADVVDHAHDQDQHDDAMQFQDGQHAFSFADSHMYDFADVPLSDMSDAGAADGVHVLVVASGLEDGDDLIAAAKDDVLVVKLDENADLSAAADAIDQALNGAKADSIAFAAHNGGHDALQFNLDSLGNEANLAAWAEIGGMVNDGGRIDLLGCYLLQGAGSDEYMTQLESITGTNVAASTDATGNEAFGGDWVLESDNIDIQDVYFDAHRLDAFDGTFAKPQVLDGFVNQSVVQWHTQDYSITSTTFLDVDGKGLVYFTNSPSWMNWDGTDTWTIAPTDASHFGDTIVMVTAAYTDWSDWVTTSFVVHVDANTPPTVQDGINDVTMYQYHTEVVDITSTTFNDIDGDSLVYFQNAPTWMNWDSVDSWNINPIDGSTIGTTTVNVTAADPNSPNYSHYVTTSFDVTVLPNTAPTIGTDLDDQWVTLGETVVLPVTGTTFNDAEGDALDIYNDAPSWMNWNASLQRWVIAPDADIQRGVTTVNVTAVQSNDPTFTNYVTTSFDVYVMGADITSWDNVNEGNPHELFIDAVYGFQNPSNYVIDWGDGTPEEMVGTGGYYTHTYDDGDFPADTNTISISVIDDFGRHDGIATHHVTVDNVRPTITLSGNGPVDEGSTFTLDFGTVSDPGVDTPYAYIVDWGDGSAEESVPATATSLTHTYADGNVSYVIAVDVVDEDGQHQDSGILSVNVQNVAPTIALTGDPTAAENSPFTLSLGAVTDPGTDTVTNYAVNWGDGTSTPTATLGNNTHTYTAMGTYTITVDITDEDGVHNAGTYTIVVDNTVPTVPLTGNAAVNEGSQYTLSVGTVTGALNYTIDWGDGTPDSTLFTAGDATHTYADGDATHTIAVTLVDGDGTHTSAGTKVVTVNNVAPTVNLSGLSSVDEGATYNLVIGNVVDPGDDTVIANSYRIDWGDGTVDLNQGSGLHSHIFADGDANYTIIVGLSDEDGVYTNAGTHAVNVNDVGPTVALFGNTTVDEGSTYTLTFGAVTDPGTDTVSLYKIDWGDGNTTTTPVANPQAHVFADQGTFNISVTLVDEEGSHTGAGNLNVTVLNVDPTVNLTGAASLDEGSIYSLNISLPNDPGDDTVVGTGGYVIDWGDGSSTIGDTPGNFTHTYSDDGTFTINVSVEDEEGVHLSAGTMNVTVNNVAPTIALSGNASVNQGASYALTLVSVTDPGDDTVVATGGYVVDWGDGSAASTVDNLGTLTHVYGSAGNFVIAVDVQDEDGIHPTAGTLAVSVNDVSPAVTLSGSTTTDEGSQYFVSFNAATGATSYTIHWGDGVVEALGNNPGVHTHTYLDGDATHTIALDVQVGATTYVSSDTHVINVSNVVPTVALSGPGNVDEGVGYLLNIGPVTDPGSDTVTGYNIYWGDGSSDMGLATAGGHTHTFADNGFFVVTVDVIDEDGTHSTAGSISVIVDNVAPTLSLSGNDPVDEGSVFTLNVDAYNDTGADTATNYQVDWGDGTVESVGTPTTAQHTYADDGSYTIVVDVDDEDGNFASAGVYTATVMNVAPTISLSNSGPVDEASQVTLTFGTETDPGADTIDTYIVNWGDGTIQNLATPISNVTHTYADGQEPSTMYNVTVSLVDEDGTFVGGTTTITVNNVAPTVGVSGSGSVDEGSTFTLTIGTPTDPGMDTLSHFVVNWGDGNTTTGVGVGDVTHVYADDSGGPFVISVDIVDEEGTYTNAANTTVTVNDVAPTITLGDTLAGPYLENTATDNYWLDFGTITDPAGPLDTATTYVVHWGDGQQSTYGPVLPGNASHAYGDDGTYTISVDIKDEDGTHPTAGTHLVNIQNVAPSVSLTATAADEGAAFTLNFAGVTDPGDDTVVTYTVHWGDGSSSSVAGSSANATHNYLDGNATYQISVDIFDEDGTFMNAGSITATINNVAPTIALTSPDTSINEGDTFQLNFGAVTDPGTDTPTQYIVYWGDGSTSNFNFGTGAAPTTGTHAYMDDGTYTVSVSVRDEDGLHAGVGTIGVNVAIIAPTVSLTGASQVDEGSGYVLNLAGLNDNEPALYYVVHWGDANTTNVATLGTYTHTYTDGDASVTISVDVVNTDGTYSTAGSLSLTVNNVAPTIALSDTGAVNEGTGTYTLVFGATTDPGSDTRVGVRTIDWGDGSTSTAALAAGSTTHTYTDDGNYTITVQLQDEDGTYTTAGSHTAVILNVAPTIAAAHGASGSTIAEGGTYNLDLTALPNEPGADTASTYIIHWGDGKTTTTAAASATFDHTFTDNGNYTVTIDIVDEDGTHLAAGTLGGISVTNVTPTATISGDGTTFEGNTYTLILSSLNNPGGIYDPGDDTVDQVIIDWGDGAPPQIYTTVSQVYTHTYVDEDLTAPGAGLTGNYTITLSLHDEDGTYNTVDSMTITANDVAPTITLSSTTATPILENTAAPNFTLNFGTVTDPGTPDTPTSYIIHWGGGPAPTTTIPTAPNATYTYTDDGSYTITVDIVNEDGTFTNAGTLQVTVSDVAPAVALTNHAGSTYAEGGIAPGYALDIGPVTDPGADVSYSYIVHWGDGTTSNQAGTPAAVVSTPHIYADDGTYTITVDVLDEEGVHANAGINVVTITDVAPVLVVTGATTTNEASPYALTLGPVTDPGNDPVQSYIVHWGDGNTTTHYATGTFTHTYADDDLFPGGPGFSGTFPIMVDIVDDDGVLHTNVGNPHTVTVNDVDPTITLADGVIGSVFENMATANYILDLGTVTDPGTDTPVSYTIHWGDGSPVSVLPATSTQASHTYTDDGTFTITVDITDEDGTHVTSGIHGVTVFNVAPAITLSDDAVATFDEGGVYILDFGTVTDPGNDALSGPNAHIVHWGDGTTGSYGTGATTATHNYADDGIYVITVDLHDDDGTHTGAGNHTVTIDNVAPTVGVAIAGTLEEGAMLTFTPGGIVDPGTDTATNLVFDWGDGTTTDPGSVPATVTHNYADDGTYTVTASIVDEDGTFTGWTTGVIIANVTPTLDLSGNPTTATVGSVYSLAPGLPTDPGDDTASGYAIKWGDGSTDVVGVGGPFTHTFMATGTYVITMDIYDEDGAWADQAHDGTGVGNHFQVVVADAPPTVTLYDYTTGPFLESPANNYTLGLTGYSDPGNDPADNYRINWGDGLTSQIAGTVTNASHAYTDDGTYIISVDVDQDANPATWEHFSIATHSVVVQNVAPTVSLTDGTGGLVNEGSMYTLNIPAVVDPGNDTETLFTVHWGDGTTSTVPGSAPANATHTYADDGTYTVSVDVTDEDDNWTDAGRHVVHVLNVNPTVVVSNSGTTADEGSPFSLILSSVNDPGDDTVTGYTIDWGDGSSDNVSALGAVTHSYTDDGVYNIQVAVQDEDGLHAAAGDVAPWVVNVANVAPTVALSGASQVDEGSPFALTIGSVTDPGNDTATAYTIDWGDGNTQIVGAAGTYTHTYADTPVPGANGVYTINVAVHDEDGSFAPTTGGGVLAVNVNNVAPTITLTDNGPANEGTGIYTLNFGTITDPGWPTGGENVFMYVVNWGDGFVSGTPAASATHTYADDGSYVITVDIIDEDGTQPSAGTHVATINDVPPTMTLSDVAGGPHPEGSAFSLYVSTITDVGNDFWYNMIIDWGDGNTTNSNVDDTTINHTYADDGAYTISVSVQDEEGTHVIPNTLPVTVTNVNPTINLLGASSVDEGSPYSLFISGYADPGDDTLVRFQIDWGDTTPADIVYTEGEFTHTYADGDTGYTITVTVFDEDTTALNVATFTQTVTVNNVPPTVSLSGGSSVDEGSQYTLTVGPVVDPGDDTVDYPHTNSVITWGDGWSTPLAAGQSTYTHTYTDGPAAYTIGVSLHDDDGTWNPAGSLAVNVMDVDPTVTLTGTGTVDEGSTYTLNFGTITDPGNDAPITSYIVHWGDGTPDNAYTAAATFGTHTYADGHVPAVVTTITVDIVDGDGTHLSAGTHQVTVNDVDPTIPLADGGVGPFFEGGVYVLDANGPINEPGVDTVSTYRIQWGDGQTETSPVGGSFNHTYADDGAYVVTVDLTDEDGLHLTAGTLPVIINNVLPTMSLTGASHVDEGSTYTLTLGTVTDPGDDTAIGYQVDWGDGNMSYTGSLGNITHVYADGVNNYVINVNIVDDDGTFTAGTLPVTVDNVAPTISITADSWTPDEGSQFNLTLGAVTDPGADTVIANNGYIVHWGDGNQDAYDNPGNVTHTYSDGVATYTLTVDVVDDDGSFTAATHAVTVANVAPVVSLDGPAVVYEGASYALTLSNLVDPGADTVNSYIIDWGDTTTSTVGALGNFNHTFPDGPATYTVSVSIVDEDGTHASAGSTTVNVMDVPPEVDLSNNDNFTYEGTPYTFIVGGSGTPLVQDPGDDTITSYDIFWGDGTTTTGVAPGAYTHTYADGAKPDTLLPLGNPQHTIYVINVTATDDDGTHPYVGRDGFGGPAFEVTVYNVEPTLGLSGALSVDEGSTYTLSLDSVTDPGDDTVSSYVIDWGDGGPTETVTGLGTVTHTYADGDVPAGMANISVAIFDEDGGYANAGSLNVLVNNVAPTITLTDAMGGTVDEGSQYTLDFGTITDPGDDTVTTIVVDWGDGSVVDLYAAGAVNATHTYADDGSFTIKVHLEDEDSPTLPSGWHATAGTHVVTVDNVAPTIDLALSADSVDQLDLFHLDLGAVTDPGDDTPTTYIIHWGDGAVPENTAAGLHTNPHTYTDAGTFTITVDIIDEDGVHTNAGTHVVQVNEIVPTVDLGGNSTNVDEGSPYTLAFNDVSGATTYTIHWGDGTSQTATTGGGYTHTYDDGNALYTIALDVTTANGSYPGVGTHDVNVWNVAPTVQTSGDAMVDEGSVFTLNLDAVVDPGDDTVFRYTIDWGDGSTDTVGALGPVTHTYADDSNGAPLVIAIDVEDEDGSFTNAGFHTVLVNNVAPSIDLIGSGTGFEGSPYTLIFGPVTDPGLPIPGPFDGENVTSYIVHWGDGTQSTTGAVNSATHSYGDDGIYTISVDVVDNDGTHVNAGTDVVSIQNVAPTISLSAPTNPVDEGQPFTLILGAVNEPGNDTVVGSNGYTIDWGDGTALQSVSNAGGATYQHTYADGYDYYTIQVSIRDEDGTHANAGSYGVSVDNVAPTDITLSGPTVVDEGTPFQLFFGNVITPYGVGDPGDDTVTGYMVDWYGDGSVIDTFGPVASATFTYPDGADAAVINVSVIDDDGTYYNIGTHAVVIADVDPVFTVSGPSIVDEGATYTLTVGAITDPGDDTPQFIVVDWGDGTTDMIATTGSADHVYEYDPGNPAAFGGGHTYQIQAMVVDEDGTHTMTPALTDVYVNDTPEVNNGFAMVDLDTAANGQNVVQVVATDDGMPSPLTFSIADDPSGAFSVSTTGMLQIADSTALTPGVTMVQVGADDGSLTGTGFIAVQVLDSTPNQPPVAPLIAPVGDGIPATEVDLHPGQFFVWQMPEWSDPDGDAVTYTAREDTDPGTPVGDGTAIPMLGTDWLQFNGAANARLFMGTVPVTANPGDSFTIEVFGSDGFNPDVNTTFDFVISELDVHKALDVLDHKSDHDLFLPGDGDHIEIQDVLIAAHTIDTIDHVADTSDTDLAEMLALLDDQAVVEPGQEQAVRMDDEQIG